MNEYKWSNCLLECVKESIKHPFNTKIKRKGSFRLIWRKKQFPHFYWYNKRENTYYHFNAKYSDEPLLYQLWFQGKIDEFHFHRKREL